MEIDSIFRDWKPRNTSKEDFVLADYFAQNPGLYFAEVPVGNPGSFPWSPPTNPRKIDAVKIIDSDFRNGGIFNSGNDITNLKEVFRLKKIQLIEAKQQLNRTVIGQLLVAKELFKEQYQPKEISLVAVVNENISDGALVWVCKNRFNIEIINQRAPS